MHTRTHAMPSTHGEAKRQGWQTHACKHACVRLHARWPMVVHARMRHATPRHGRCRRHLAARPGPCLRLCPYLCLSGRAPGPNRLPSSAPAPCSPQIDLENQLEAEQEYILNKLQKQVDKLAGEKGALAKEKSDLQRQITDLGASVERLNRDKVVLEQQMEMEEENIGACAPRLSILEHGGLCGP